MKVVEENAHDLIAYATKHPKGFTRDEAESDLGINGNDFGAAKRKARLILAADGDDRALIVTPGIRYAQWVYVLTSDFSKARRYVHNRVKDSETRLVSILATMATCVTATDGRSVDGKIARRMRRVVSRLVEDIADIKENAS